MIDGGFVYIDTSAFLKLVATEQHSDALTSWLTDNDAKLVSSDLLRTEALRAVRDEAPEAAAAVRGRLTLVGCVRITRTICDLAADLPPLVMRTLDAIHVATALTLAPEVDTVLTYDRRMADAVAVAGLNPLSPGQA